MKKNREFYGIYPYQFIFQKCQKRPNEEPQNIRDRVNISTQDVFNFWLDRMSPWDGWFSKFSQFHHYQQLDYLYIPVVFVLKFFWIKLLSSDYFIIFSDDFGFVEFLVFFRLYSNFMSPGKTLLLGIILLSQGLVHFFLSKYMQLKGSAPWFINVVIDSKCLN